MEKEGILTAEAAAVLYVDRNAESDPEDVSESVEIESKPAVILPKPSFGSALKTPISFGGALKRKAPSSETRLMEPKKKVATMEIVQHESSSSESESEEEAVPETQDKTSAAQNQVASSKQEEDEQIKIEETKEPEPVARPPFYVLVNRSPEIQESRLQLPIVAEEPQIMESISENDTIVLCGETGSGKTTQLPQFLYEAGYGNPDGPRSGKIGVTQPRRVAAVSMARRVATELNLTEKQVSYQIRYDGTTSAETKIKFMTDGVLLKEISSDLLLLDYSVIIIDEAHERSLNTDILIGLLSRVVKLRRRLFESKTEKIVKGKKITVQPLKLIIMSATLRIEDFVGNRTLFADAPPVVRVDARQYPVAIHFNRRTPDDYITAAYKKVVKIHTRLAAGGILIFLTGQNEITGLCKKLRKRFPQRTITNGEGATDSPVNKSVEDNSTGLMEASELGERLESTKESPERVDDAGDDDIFDDSDLSEEEDMDEDLLGENEMPLYVLPLYALLPTAQQMKVFQNPPPGMRLCVVATNVAETSLTIPGIRYVVDCGKVKERQYDPETGVSSFVTTWTSKASADQRAGRAGRVGPGHCYRLFSSAVFENYFAQFSLPEILRMSIEGVVLQMKRMQIDSVINFPFPLAPERDQLVQAEAILVQLGALNMSTKRITKLGDQMSQFPVSPRLAKMLVACMKRPDCLGYAITLVAALSVDDPFIRQIHVGEKEDGDQSSDDEESETKSRNSFQRVMALLSNSLNSDHLTLVRAVCAFDHAQDQERFCDEHFLRFKTMQEIQKLRGQLCRVFQALFPNASMPSLFQLPPFSDDQIGYLRDLLLGSYMDHVAVMAPKEYAKQRVQPYHALNVNLRTGEPQSTVFIHPSSSIINNPPRYLVFQELQQSSASANSSEHVLNPEKPSKIYMKGVTALPSLVPLVEMCPSLCHFGKPMEQPPAFYDQETDALMAYTMPSFGKVHSVDLPPMAVPMSMLQVSDSERMRWTARALLDGSLCPKLKQFVPSLISKPSLVTHAKLGINHGKVAPWIQAMLRHKFGGAASCNLGLKKQLKTIWATSPSFLLDPYLKAIDSSQHEVIKALWPPIRE